AHSFQHHEKGFFSIFRICIVAADFGVLLKCENSRAGITAVALDIVADSKLFNFIVLAFTAGHCFLLAFCGRKPENEVEANCPANPAIFGLALQLASTGCGAFTSNSYGLG